MNLYAIYILCIVAWPLLETIRLSFTNSSLAGEDYVGFENYEKMFSSKKFNKIVIRTFIWMFFSVSLKLIIFTQYFRVQMVLRTL